MTFTHALGTNNYGPTKFIVSSSPANGTHTTLTTAMAAASVGDTIEIRDATLTENVTITPGVNITGFGVNGDTPNVTINGTLTMTGAGTSTITGIRLQTNSVNAIVVSGSAASILNLNNCYLNCTNTTGISFTSSNASATIRLHACRGNLATTGIGIYSMTSAGTLELNYCRITNTGSSLTASTHSAGSVSIVSSYLFSPFSSTSTGLSVIYNSQIDCQTLNTTAFAFGGTSANMSFCYFSSGSATTITLAAAGAVTLNDCVLFSSNTNAISGAGSLTANGISFNSTGIGNTATTFTPLLKDLVLFKASKQPCLSAYRSATLANQTGDNTTFTVLFDTVNFDQGSNYTAGTGSFAFPRAGKFLVSGAVAVTGIGVQNYGNVNIVATSQTVNFYYGNMQNLKDGFTNYSMCFNKIISAAANTDTMTITAVLANGTKTVGLIGGATAQSFLTVTQVA